MKLIYSLLFSLGFLANTVSMSAYAQGIAIKSNKPLIVNKNQLVKKQSMPLLKNLQEEIDVSKIQYLGNLLLDKVPGLYGDSQTQSAIAVNFQSQKQPFCTYLYNNVFVIQTSSKTPVDLLSLNTTPSQDWELYYTVRALQLFQSKYSVAYMQLITNSLQPNYSSLSSAAHYSHINKFSKVVISFSDFYGGIAISGTLLGKTTTPVSINGASYTVWNNLPIITIGSTLLKGNNQNKGTYPIYKRPTAEENFQLYMKEGLVHTIVHELIHRVTDVKNNEIGSVYNYIYNTAGRSCHVSDGDYPHPSYDVEEIAVANTTNKYFRSAGGISSELLSYYDGVVAGIQKRIGPVYYTHYTIIMGQKKAFNPSDITYTLLN